MGLENICAMNRERQLIRTSRVVRLNSREDYYSDDAAMYPRLATATQSIRTVYAGKGATEAAGPALGRVLLCVFLVWDFPPIVFCFCFF